MEMGVVGLKWQLEGGACGAAAGAWRWMLIVGGLGEVGLRVVASCPRGERAAGVQPWDGHGEGVGWGWDGVPWSVPTAGLCTSRGFSCSKAKCS